MTLIERLFVFGSIAGITVALIYLIAYWRQSRLPYRGQVALFSAAEQRFLHALEATIDDDVRIYAKVRIADIVAVREGLSEKRFWTAFTPIASKHVDYVLCDRSNFEILAVIELDDASHQRIDRQQRDAFVDKVMAAAQIPILHIAVQREYDSDELLEQLQTVL